MSINPELDTPTRIIEAAAHVLSSTRYVEVSLENVALALGEPAETVSRYFASMHEVATEVLRREGDSMRAAQRRATEATNDPLDILRTTFRFVGENVATMVVVRAGMRLAAESRDSFIERHIDPYRTWNGFVTGCLGEARDRGMLRDGVDLPSVVWLLVSAGMGTKELVGFREAWHEMPERLESVASTVIDSIRRSGHA